MINKKIFLKKILTTASMLAISLSATDAMAAAITISSKNIEKTKLRGLVDRYNNYHPSEQAQNYSKYRGVYINGTDAVQLDMSPLTALNPALNTINKATVTSIENQNYVKEAKIAMSFLNTEEGKTFQQLLDDTRNTIITAIHPAAVGTSMSKKLGIQNNIGKIPNDILGGNITPTPASGLIPDILFNDNVKYAKIVGARLGQDSQWAEYFSQILSFAKNNENISQANQYFINHQQLGNEYNKNYVQSGRNSKKEDEAVMILHIGSQDDISIDTYRYILAKALKDNHLTTNDFLNGAINKTAPGGSGLDRRLAVKNAVEHYNIQSTDLTNIDNGFYNSQHQKEMDQSVLDISIDKSNVLLQGLKKKIEKSFETRVIANGKGHINTTLFDGFSDEEMVKAIQIASLVGGTQAKIFIPAFNDTYGRHFLNMIKDIDYTAPYEFEHEFTASSAIPDQYLSYSAAQHALESKKVMDANTEVKNEAVKLLSEAGYGTAYSITTTFKKVEKIINSQPDIRMLIASSKENAEIIKEYNSIMSGFNKVLPKAADNFLLEAKKTTIQKKLELVNHGNVIVHEAVKFAYEDDEDEQNKVMDKIFEDDTTNTKNKEGVKEYLEMLDDVTRKLQQAQSTTNIDTARANGIRDKEVIMTLNFDYTQNLVERLTAETEEYGEAGDIIDNIDPDNQDINLKDEKEITEYNNLLVRLLKYKAIDDKNRLAKVVLENLIDKMHDQYYETLGNQDVAIKVGNEDALEKLVSLMNDDQNPFIKIAGATPNEIRRVANLNIREVENYCTTVEEANRTKDILAVLAAELPKYVPITLEEAKQAAIRARESQINIGNAHIDVVKDEALRLSKAQGNLFDEDQYNAALAATDNTDIEGLDLDNAKAWRAVYEILTRALAGAENLNAKQAVAQQYKAKMQDAGNNVIDAAIATLVQNKWPLDNIGHDETDRTNTVRQILGYNDEWITDRARTHEEINQYNRVMRIMNAEVGYILTCERKAQLEKVPKEVEDKRLEPNMATFNEILSSDFSAEEVSSYVQEHKAEVAQVMAKEYNVNQSRVQQMLEDNIIASKADSIAIISTIAQEEKVEQTQHMNHSQQHSEVMSVAMDNVTSRIIVLVAPSMSDSGSAGSTMAPVASSDSGGSSVITPMSTSDDGGTSGSTAAPTATGGENENNSNDNNGSNEDTLLEASGAGIAAGDAYERFGVWAQVIGGVGKQKARKGASGFASNMIGGMIGADTLINDRTLIGLTFGNINNNVKFKNAQTGDKSKSSSWVFSAYAHQQLDNNWFVSGNVAYTKTSVDNKDQRLTGPGRKDMAQSKYNIHSFGLEMTVGKSLGMKNGVIVVPSVGLRAAHTNKISYQETGSTKTNQKITQNASNNVQGVAGLQVMKMFEQNGTTITPDIHANVQYGLGVKSPKGTYTSQFDSNAVSYTGLKPSRISSTVGVGLTMKSGSVECGISYDANISAGYLGHQGTLKLKVKF